MITRVLSYWQPKANLKNYFNNNRNLVDYQFKTYLAYLGFNITIQSSSTPDVLVNWYKETKMWHRDENNIDRKFIVWSNVQPTDVLFPNNSMLEVRNGAIILINNLKCYHRTPTPLNPNRWFIRTDYLK